MHYGSSEKVREAFTNYSLFIKDITEDGEIILGLEEHCCLDEWFL